MNKCGQPFRQRMLTHLSDQDPEEASMLGQIIKRLFGGGRRPDRDWLDPALVERVKAHIDRGLAPLDEEQIRESVNEFSAAIELTTGDYWAPYHHRGVSYSQLGDYTRAIFDMDEAIRLNPDRAESYVDRGSPLAFVGDFERAQRDYARAIDLDRDSIRAYVNRAALHEPGRHREGNRGLFPSDCD